MKKLITLISSLSFITPSSTENQSYLIESAQLVLNIFNRQTVNPEFNWRDITPALHEISIHGHSLPEVTQNQLESIGFNFSGSIINRTLDMRSHAS
ncbi:uncharacterized protein METZ01_LOCUS355191, partial [marine metagenome]